MKAVETSAAATDVAALIGDLDGGQFERMLSIAVSQVAAGVVDNKRVGEVSIKLHIEHIPGTSQVNLKHTLKFARPTADGKAGEEATRTTVLHVGKYGKLTLTPENQLKMFGETPQATA